MKIDKLTLTNFRNHERSTFDLSPVTFVIAPNAAGKSGIAFATEWLLTGRCAFTDAAGRGSEDLIRVGAKELSVSASIRCAHGPEPVNFTRTKNLRSQTFSVNGSPRDVRSARDAVEQILGVSTEVLSACLNAGRFLQMTEKEQKELLSAVLATEKIQVPESLIADMKIISGGGAITEIASPSEADTYHKLFFSERTDTNRDLKALGTVEPPAGEPLDISEVKSQLAGLREQKSSLEQRKSNTEGQHTARINSYNQRHSEIKRRIAVAESNLLPKQQADELEKVAANAEKVTDADAKVATYRKALDNRVSEIKLSWTEQLSTLRAEISGRESQINSLKSLSAAACPTCERAFTKQDKERIVSLGIRLDGEVSEMRRKLKDAEAAQFNGGDNEQRQEIATLEEKLKKAQAKRAELGDPIAAERQLRGHRIAMVDIDKCNRELKELKEPEAVSTAKWDEEIKTLAERIGSGERILEEAQADTRKREAYDNWVARKLALENRVEILNRLISYFGPDGVKKEMVGDKAGPFMDAINGILTEFGYMAKFTTEPYSFLVGSPVSSPHGPVFNLKQLSESEQWRFGAAFSIALAKTVGLNFVVLDRADCLDESSRDALFGMVLNAEMDQVIVLATSEKDAPHPNNLPDGCKFIQLGASVGAAA